MILKRNTTRLLGSTLATWYANKVRYETTHDASTQAHAILEANQKQMGRRNHELWISLKDNKEKQMQIGMKTLHSIFSRFHKFVYNGVVNIWRNTASMERNIWKETRSLKMVAGIQKLASLFSTLGMMAIQKIFMTLKTQFGDYKSSKSATMRIGLSKITIVVQTITLMQISQAVSNWQVAAEQELAEIAAKLCQELEQRVERAEERAEEKVERAEQKAAEHAQRAEQLAEQLAQQAEEKTGQQENRIRELEESACAAYAEGQEAQKIEEHAIHSEQEEAASTLEHDKLEARNSDQDSEDSKFKVDRDSSNADEIANLEDQSQKDHSQADCDSLVTVAAVGLAVGSTMLIDQSAEDVQSAEVMHLETWSFK